MDDALLRWRSARDVLCVRLDTIGDVLMTTPALRAVRGTPRARRVTLLTSGAGAAIARLVPEVDEVIAYDAPWLKHGAACRADDGFADREMIARLRARRFDAAVIFTVYSQSALPAAMMCHLAGIPLRAAHCRENPYRLLTDRVPESEPEQGVRHEVRRQLDLAAALGFRTADERLSLALPPGAVAHVRALLRSLGIEPGRPWVIVHPGATAPSRRYPAGQFAKAARLLMERTGCKVVVTGDDSERALAAEVCEGVVGATSVAGQEKIDLAALAALIGAAPLLITNNTGPAHIAAALGTPVVDLYALTNPQHTPWMVAHRTLSFDVPCKYCYSSICLEGHHDCLRRIGPEEVVDAACELLESRAHTRPVAEGAGA
ncbi:MAG TPA: glycosyltransferase family 9 protein [Gemmatimonadaceae bacterium]|nr:glycosyltransferase family 9 protein [Gemmatimonadaceae bacterium]